MTIEVQGVEFALPADAFSTVGFSSDQALLPYPKNVYDGYRILQEYLSFPEAFHFFDVKGFAKALPKAVSGDFTLRIHFSKTLPADTRVRQDNFQLYCTPVINLFEHDADPIDLTGRRSEYRIVRPVAILPTMKFSAWIKWLVGKIPSQKANGSAEKSVSTLLLKASNMKWNGFVIVKRFTIAHESKRASGGWF